jgi:LmbE family N-acetylglucosaminyl deacetylase
MLITFIGGAVFGLDTLRLQPNERIVIIAPHPDDEVLACGGLIQQALALGDSVWVVYVTSGDGSWPAAWRVTGNMFPGPADYLALGRARIAEAKAGAQVLGLDTTHLIFLGYPDGELHRLVFEHHFDVEPVRSSHTGASSNPYFQSRYSYRGASIAADLYDEMARLGADRVFFPHPLDAHPDHWATAAVLPAIREFWRQAGPREFPSTYHYLVHRPPYPDGNLSQRNELEPPKELEVIGHHWYTLPNSAQIADRKREAIKTHWSQDVMLGPDMAAFIAGNELFDQVQYDDGAARGDAPAVGLWPSLRIDSLRASVTSGKSLVFRLYFRNMPSREYDYRLYVWSFGPGMHDRVVDLWGTEETGDLSETMARDSLLVTLYPLPITWAVYLPSTWFAREGLVFFTADVRRSNRLLNHAGVGWIVPSRD